MFTADSFPGVNLLNDNPHNVGFWWGPVDIHAGWPQGCFPKYPNWNGEDRFFHFITEDKIPARNSNHISVGLSMIYLMTLMGLIII